MAETDSCTRENGKDSRSMNEATLSADIASVERVPILEQPQTSSPPPDYLEDLSGYDDYIVRTYTAEELTQRRRRCYIRFLIGFTITAAVCTTLGIVFGGRLQDRKKVCTIRGPSQKTLTLESGTETENTSYFWWGAIIRRWTYSNGTDITRNLQYSVDRCDQVILQGPAHMTSGAINFTKPQTVLEFRDNFILNASSYILHYPVIPSVPAFNPDNDSQLYEFTESSGRDGCTSPSYINVRFQPFIYIKNTGGIAITGKGIIDGGGDFWSLFCGDKRLTAERPNLVEISHSQNILISNVTLDNSAMWPLNALGSSGIVLENVTVGSRASLTASLTPFSKTFFYIPKFYVDINLVLTQTGTALLVGQEDILSGQNTLFTSQPSEDVAENWPEFANYCDIQSETTDDEGNITFVQVGDFIGTFGDIATGGTMAIAVSPSFDETTPEGRFDEVILMNTPNILDLIFNKISEPEGNISLWDLPVAGGILSLAYTLIKYQESGQFDTQTFLEEFVLLYPKDWNLTTIVCTPMDNQIPN